MGSVIQVLLFAIILLLVSVAYLLVLRFLARLVLRPGAPERDPIATRRGWNTLLFVVGFFFLVIVAPIAVMALMWIPTFPDAFETGTETRIAAVVLLAIWFVTGPRTLIQLRRESL